MFGKDYWLNIPATASKSQFQPSITKFYKLNVEDGTFNIQSPTLNIKYGTLNIQSATLNVEVGTFNIQLYEFNLQLGIFNIAGGKLKVDDGRFGNGEF